VSAVDHAHSAGADVFDDAIVTEGSPKHRGGVAPRARILGCDLRDVNF
jgi:hypothetical protein